MCGLLDGSLLIYVGSECSEISSYQFYNDNKRNFDAGNTRMSPGELLIQPIFPPAFQS